MQSGENAQNQLKTSLQKHFQANGWSDTLIARSNAMADLKLNPKTIAIIQDKVDSGLYNDADDVVLTALKTLDEQDRDYLALKESLLVAEAQFARGEGIRLTPEVFEEIKRQAREMASAGHQPSRDVQP
jgi:Arc/MetJ-type ribon-helix-helix transcriptional regulator